MMHDRFLYDRATGNWTIDRWLQDVDLRYGGVDSVLLWHSYPNIGVDDRNQFQMLQSLPDFPALVSEFNQRGIKVLLPYNPWDTGTARPPTDDATALVEAIEQSGASGFNGDTMFGLNNSYYELSKRTHARTPVVAQPECGADGDGRLYRESAPNVANVSGVPVPYTERGSTIAFNTLSWAYWGIVPPGVYSCGNCSASGGVINASVRMSVPYAGIGPPLVSRYRMLDARHMAQVCQRWAIDRDDGLQHAWINGAGYVPWESIWGIWNPLSERHGETLRRTMHVLKFFQARAEAHATGTVAATAAVEAEATALLLPNGPHSFQPLVALGQPPGVFCSWLYHSASSELLGQGDVLTCVNRRGDQLPADAADPTTLLPGDAAVVTMMPCAPLGLVYYDVWMGVLLPSERYPCEGGSEASAGNPGHTALPVNLSDTGYGALALLPLPAQQTAATVSFLARRRAFARTPLSSLSAQTEPLPQTLVPPSPPPPAPHPYRSRANTTLIPAASYEFEVHGVQVEGAGGLGGPDLRSQPDVQWPWEDRPTRMHAPHVIEVAAFAIDTHPVSMNTARPDGGRLSVLRRRGSQVSHQAGLTRSATCLQVTNARYHEFLQRTGWRPPTTEKNWLAHWVTSTEVDSRGVAQTVRTPPPRAAEQPVRWVSRPDAEAFCAAEGKRLPHSCAPPTPHHPPMRPNVRISASPVRNQPTGVRHTIIVRAAGGSGSSRRRGWTGGPTPGGTPGVTAAACRRA
jgi:iron(II)-dependent oxidoreductase